jgi:hypothetical protein
MTASKESGKFFFGDTEAWYISLQQCLVRNMGESEAVDLLSISPPSPTTHVRTCPNFSSHLHPLPRPILTYAHPTFPTFTPPIHVSLHTHTTSNNPAQNVHPSLHHPNRRRPDRHRRLGAHRPLQVRRLRPGRTAEARRAHPVPKLRASRVVQAEDESVS